MAVVVDIPNTKKNQIQILMIINESCYDSPDDSDAETLANKRARTDDDSSSTSKETFNRLHAEQLNNTIQKYKKSYSEKIPKEIPLSNFRDLSSLNPGKNVHDSCINDWAKHLITVFNLSESVLYIPTYLYRHFFTDQNKIEDEAAEKIVRYLANNKAIKKDYILVGMQATPINQHWILGVIMLDAKKITIIDPVNYSDGIDSRHHTNLLRITSLAHKLSGIELKLDQWHLYYPNNVPRTNNVENAGILVCYYIYNLAFGIELTSFPDKDVKNYRRRIQYVLSSAKEIWNQGDSMKYPRETLLQYNECLRQKFGTFSERLDVKSFDVIYHDSASKMLSGSCSDPWCGQALTSYDDMNQVKCISCRKYYHCNCVEADQSTIVYFHCYICIGML